MLIIDEAHNIQVSNDIRYMQQRFLSCSFVTLEANLSMDFAMMQWNMSCYGSQTPTMLWVMRPPWC